MRDFSVTYRPYHADKERFGKFHLQEHTNNVTIEAKSVADARVKFHEGNHGEVVSIVPIVYIENPTKMWSPIGPDCNKKEGI